MLGFLPPSLMPPASAADDGRHGEEGPDVLEYDAMVAAINVVLELDALDLLDPEP